MQSIYWITTSLLSLFLLLSAYSYLVHESTIDGVRALGIPDFLRIELAVLKVLALLVLLMPAVPLLFKEWAYVGVSLFLLTALIAHLSNGDSPAISVLLLALGGLLYGSYYSLHQLP